ncbi:MAG: ferredoxin family protein [Proteobacteria bacterium]|nr:ferredoxin family protein [Pseudomonadota bacterium]
MGVRKIDTELCTGCGLCVRQCPMDVLRLDTSKEPSRAFIKYLRDCQSCALCEDQCPEVAITVFPTFERRVPTAW